jgi:hypothetical protein
MSVREVVLIRSLLSTHSSPSIHHQHTINYSRTGLSTIRAFSAERATAGLFEERLETNGRAWYHWLLVNRWVGFNLDLIR